MLKPNLRLLGALFLVAAGTQTSTAFNVIEGTVFEVTSPNDLLLDSANAAIAVDVFGDFDEVVNGVTFQADGQVLGSGTVTNGAVSVTTTAPNGIPTWAAAPLFGGGAPTADDFALGDVMRTIRWANTGASQTLTSDITGLTVGETYNVQLLFNEGQNTGNRRFDIVVNGALVVDDMSSHGGVHGSWTNANSFAWSADFLVDGTGALNLLLDKDPLPADPNNTPPPVPSDNNPILQGLIVHIIPPTAPTEIALSGTEFSSISPSGTVIGTLSSVDRNRGDTHSYTLEAGAGDTDNASFQIVGDELQTNDDFTALGGTTFSVRVRSTDSGAQTFEEVFMVTAQGDTDADNLLDPWEDMFTADLNDLTGLLSGPGPGAGTGDFDGDGSSDLDEFNNGSNPILADTDGDGSNDGDEATNGTDPNNPDTDGDGLNDGDEATETTDPLVQDTDGDGLGDGDEVLGTTRGEATSPILADSDGDTRDDLTDPEPNNIAVFSRTKTPVGEVLEFAGPDDLNLDPLNSVIAVDVFGDADRVINGVTFRTGGQAANIGTATEGGVSVTTTSTRQINNWIGLQSYTGGTAGSAANLAEVMRDMRWEAAPGPVNVAVAGLDPTLLYDLQLLLNEGSAFNRYFDISVESGLVADNISTHGREWADAWTPNNGFAYRGQFTPSGDGVLDIVMQQQLGGDAPIPGDNNPVLLGVIVNYGPNAPTDITVNPPDILTSVGLGDPIGTLNSVDVNGADTHSYALVAGAGDTNNGSFQISGDELQANADFSGQGGNVFSIRVQSTDNGGLSSERVLLLTVLADNDADNLLDSWELATAGNTTDLTGLLSGPGPGTGSGDFDNDGSPDLDEFLNGTDPVAADSDADGSNDGDEATNGTDPLDPDSDDDGLNDGDETTAGSNPLLADTDGDGLFDGDEVLGTTLGEATDPTLADSDGDGRDDPTDPAPNDNAIVSQTNVIVGEIVEFKGPDDLHLDPASAVIAVDVFGAIDKDVNGVLFQTDGQFLGSGSVTNGDVTVTTTAPNGIPNWSNPTGGGITPTFTGGTPGSADNLEVVMESIRWNPGPVFVDIEGLLPDGLYEIQLLTNEGRQRGAVRRTHDIAVEDLLVVDAYTSSGAEFLQSWATDNSFAYTAEFIAPPDGILNVAFAPDIGGNPPWQTADNNPILQGIVVHLLVPPPSTELNFVVEDSGGDLVFSWDSRAGKLYDILSIGSDTFDLDDPANYVDPSTWPVFMGDIGAAPPRNTTGPVARPADARMVFVVLEKDPPPVFEDDFETDKGWTMGSNNVNPGTTWDLGSPTLVGPPTGANSGLACYGTNISTAYEFNADIWLRSPAIDLTDPGITGATLKFFQYVDIESDFDDRGIVRVVRASDDVPLGAVMATDIWGLSDWSELTLNLPPEALGEEIKIEFQFQSDDAVNLPGWYIDDVRVFVE